MEVKVMTKSEGKTIWKFIPETLLSQYLQMGWELYKEPEKENEKPFKQNKDNKKVL